MIIVDSGSGVFSTGGVTVSLSRSTVGSASCKIGATCCHAHSVLFLPMHSLLKGFRLSCFGHSILLFACHTYCFVPANAKFAHEFLIQSIYYTNIDGGERYISG